ncbi:uncharacterized protein LOC116306499 [Actinia tenebrosa]|uniref:Uncharacterized protein LOC116306499 n=1 Tax=Actinia tenebrosa TaxID=6105 RepID=A0A6P8J2Z9_ACTTE|nr:uncharacterized protein LOC116306499 [Actinia tenebrosa]
MPYENSKPEEAEITILHVVGSPDSLFYFKLCIYYASSCKEFDKHVSFRYAVIHPDGLWSFPDSLEDLGPNGILPLDEAMANISKIKPDVLMHHLFCKRGTSEYRGILERLNFPMIGSSAQVASICQSKSQTRNVLQKHGIRVPEGRIVSKDDDIDILMDIIPLPWVVKPDGAEDSVGVSLVRTTDQLDGALEEAYKHDNIAVVERFIAGREVRVAVLSDHESNLKVLPLLEYVNIKKDEIRSFEAKLDVDEKGLPIGKAACSKPVFLDEEKEPDLVRNLSECAKSAFRALQLRDFGLFDMRVDDDGIPWILEANLFCSFGPKSVMMGMAKHAGISCDQSLSQMVQNALARNHSVAV